MITFQRSRQKSVLGLNFNNPVQHWSLAWPPVWRPLRPLLTCAVADAPVLDNVVAVQDAERLDFLLEVLHGGLLVGLQLLYSHQLARVITQRVVTTKFNAAKVSLWNVDAASACHRGTHWNNGTVQVFVFTCRLLGQTLLFRGVRCSAGAAPQTRSGPRYQDWCLSKLGYVWLTQRHEVSHSLQWNCCFTDF